MLVKYLYYYQYTIQHFYYYRCVFFDACVLGVLPAARLLPCSDIPLCIARCRSKRETGREKVRAEHKHEKDVFPQHQLSSGIPCFVLRHCCAPQVHAQTPHMCVYIFRDTRTHAHIQPNTVETDRPPFILQKSQQRTNLQRRDIDKPRHSSFRCQLLSFQKHCAQAFAVLRAVLMSLWKLVDSHEQNKEIFFSF